MRSLYLFITFALLAPIYARVDHRFISKRDPPPETSWIEMPVDHFGDYNGTYYNRFWFNPKYYKAGGPVFLYDVGEANANDASYLLADTVPNPVMSLSKRYHGLGIVWEHRYYGHSMPFNITEDDNTEDVWKYHTVEQALEDVVYFANSFSFPHPDNHTAAYRPHPNTTPWVFIGGSYPGARAAFIRVRNPEIIYASWSSSAPVQAQVDMSSYWQTPEKALPRNCSADWIAVTKYVDGVLKNGSDSEVYNLKHALTAAEYTGPGGNTSNLEELGVLEADYVNKTNALTAAWYLMDPLSDWQNSGIDVVTPFCDVLETQNFTAPAYADGLLAHTDMETTLNAFLLGIAETDPEKTAVVNVPAADTESQDTLSWTYQWCSEFGFFQVSDPSYPKNIETTFQSWNATQEFCLSTFPWLGEPNVENILKPYGGWNMNPTHVMFTNGEWDPWRTLSIASFEDNAPHKIGSAAVPQCHTAPSNKTYFGAVFRGAEHCKDLGAGNDWDPAQPFYTAMALFTAALDEWLPCFSGAKMDSNGQPRS